MEVFKIKIEFSSSSFAPHGINYTVTVLTNLANPAGFVMSSCYLLLLLLLLLMPLLLLLLPPLLLLLQRATRSSRPRSLTPRTRRNSIPNRGACQKERKASIISTARQQRQALLTERIE